MPLDSSIIAPITYLMCGLSSLVCALLLTTTYRRNKTRFLLFSSICFVGLAVSNILLCADLILFPHLDLLLIRHIVSMAAFFSLIWGFIWEIR